MRQIVLALSAFALAFVAGCQPAAQAPTEIAWRHGDVEDAFAEAAEAGKPILLYWGAVWCPPCNRLKATLFRDAAFIRQTQDFIPVYLDGDSEGAQLWGDQFQISGYPTFIILRPDRTEITRLAGAGDSERFVRALTAARESQASVAELAARAQSAPHDLTASEWTLLAEYGWPLDANRVAPEGQRAAILQTLAANAPDATQARRFELLALSEAEAGQTLTPAQQARVRTLLETVLANAAETRANRDVLSYDGAKLISLVPVDTRAPVQAALIAALDRLYALEDLPIVDRLATTYAELEIFRASAGDDAAIPAALLAKVRERAAWADRTAQTPFERQSAIADAAELLNEAGDAAGAERLLTAELEHSAAPYYYMPDLAALAEERGDKAGALQWLRRGYETSVGSASRVQWGTLYAIGVTRLAPTDKAQVEQATTAIIDELATNPDSFHQRTRVRFGRLETALRTWAAANNGADVLTRLRAHMAETCPRTQTEDAARQACASWLAAAT